MARQKTDRKLPPVKTPEARENQLINLAIDLAERQLIKGNASSQVITHFLKLATERDKLEKAKLEANVKLAEAKIKAIASQEEIKVLYENAIEAMKSYAGFYGEQDD